MNLIPPALWDTLFVTLLIEGVILLLFRIRDRRIWILFILMNVTTNLTMNWLLEFLRPYLMWLTILEVIIFILEGLLYGKVSQSIRKGLLLSLVCNLASLVGGYLLNVLIFGGNL